MKQSETTRLRKQHKLFVTVAKKLNTKVGHNLCVQSDQNQHYCFELGIVHGIVHSILRALVVYPKSIWSIHKVR